MDWRLSSQISIRPLLAVPPPGEELRVRGWQPTVESAEEAQNACSGEQRKM